MKILTYFGGIIVSLIYLGIQALYGDLPIKFDLAFSAILLFTLGLPHGAGDHIIAAKLNKSGPKKFNLIKFIFTYLLVMAIYGICWYFLPKLSLIVFIGISVFHFGDLENEKMDSKKDGQLAYWTKIGRSVLLGTGILGWILATHWNETKEILKDMTILTSIQLPSYASEISFFLIILGYQTKNNHYFLHTLSTLLLGSFLPLYPAFMCYFGACHGTYSLSSMSKHLDIPIPSLLYQLLPFSLLATFFGTVYVITFQNQIVITQIFIFLSLLTLPHFFLMHKMAHGED